MVQTTRRIRGSAGHHEEARLQRNQAAADKVQTRNLATYRDAAVLVTDQLKKIYIDGELDILETAQWYARLARKDYTIGLNVTGVSVDDPDGNLVENYSCKSERNYTQYCNAGGRPVAGGAIARDSTRTSARQSSGTSSASWSTTPRARSSSPTSPPIAGSPMCKNYIPHDNSQYNSLRFEDVWLDK